MTANDYLSLAQLQEKDLNESVEKYLSRKKEYNYGTLYDKDCGKYVIQRKITALRQTLMNLEKTL